MPKKMILIVVMGALLAAGVVLVLSRQRTFTYAGTIEATEVTLSARVTGVIKNMAAQEGDTVAAGDVLVALSTEDLDVALAAASREFERARELVAAGSLNREAFDRIKFRYEDASVRKAWGTIRAPSGGTVLNRYREPGELVGPGTRLLTLAGLDTVWAYVYVPQPMLAHLSLGMPVKAVVTDDPGRTVQGMIIKINNEAEFTPKNVQTRAERTRLVYGIKIQFSNPDRFLKPGMVVEAVLPDA